MEVELETNKALPATGTVAIWTKNFCLLCMANLAVFISMQLLLPTLPIYLLKIGGNQRDVGYVMAAFTIAAMMIRPLAGWLVDCYGRKKVLMLGITLMVVVALLYQSTAAAAVLPILLIRTLHGIGFGIVSTALGTMVADALPISRLGEGMGYFGLTTSLSMALAPMLGLWLVATYEYHYLFLAVLICTLLAFAGSTLVKNVPNSIPKAPQGASPSFWSNLVEKKALPAAGVMFFLTIIYGAVLSFIALFALEKGIDNIGLFFTTNAVVTLLSRPFAGRWTDTRGPNMVILVSLIALLISLVGIAMSTNILNFALAGAVFGLGFGCCVPTLQALAVLHAPAHRRGAATGTFFAAFDFGIGFGTIVWGFVAAAFGYQIMFLATLLPLVIAGMLYLKFRN